MKKKDNSSKESSKAKSKDSQNSMNGGLKKITNKKVFAFTIFVRGEDFKDAEENFAKGFWLGDDPQDPEIGVSEVDDPQILEQKKMKEWISKDILRQELKTGPLM